MVIDFKLIELLNCQEIFNKISQIQVKASLAFRISKIVKAINEELTKFNELRMELFTKYGEKNEGTNELVITEKNKDKFMSELNQLLEETVTLNFTKIDISEIDDLKLSTVELFQLEKFLEE